MNELKIVTGNPLIERIAWNKDEAEELALSIKAKYNGLVYTSDNISWAKQDRADINKVINQLEEKRKEVKKIYDAPYKEFEKEIKEVEEILKSQIHEIDSSLNEYEVNRKEEKNSKITEAWEELDRPDWLSLKKIFDPKWLNVSVSMNKIKADILDVLSQIKSDMEYFDNLNEEENMVAINSYKMDLDFKNAISNVEKYREYKAISSKVNNSTTNAEKSVETQSGALQIDSKDRENVILQVRVSASEYKALTNWLKSHNIPFMLRLDLENTEDDDNGEIDF